jgi:hypothetical protein
MSKGGAKLPAFLSQHLAGANVPQGASKAFCNLVKAIGESGTNHVRVKEKGEGWKRFFSVSSLVLARLTVSPPLPYIPSD